MKTLPGNNAGPQWSSKLIDDLSFIKKHHRYPLSKKTLIPTFSLLLIVACSSWMIYTTVFRHKMEISAIIWFVLLLLAVSVFGAIYNYYNLLRFKTIPTGYASLENRKLVDEFLTSQQLNVFRHPQAPEVLQILSRPLGNNTEQREVMIFIADDKRLLINSHFINQKWTVSPQSRNYRIMANRLKEWMKIHYPARGASIVAQ
jgi:hypothetical protein